MDLEICCLFLSVHPTNIFRIFSAVMSCGVLISVQLCSCLDNCSYHILFLVYVVDDDFYLYFPVRSTPLS